METVTVPYTLNETETKDMLFHAFRFIATYPECWDNESWVNEKKHTRCIGSWILEFNGVHIMGENEYYKSAKSSYQSYWDYISNFDAWDMLNKLLTADKHMEVTDDNIFDPCNTLAGIACMLTDMYGDAFTKYVITWLQ